MQRLKQVFWFDIVLCIIGLLIIIIAHDLIDFFFVETIVAFALLYFFDLDDIDLGGVKL